MRELGATRGGGGGGSLTTVLTRYTMHEFDTVSTAEVYIPNNYLQESGTNRYFNQIIAPLGGEITDVLIWCETAAGSTTITVYEQLPSGGALTSRDSDTVVISAKTPATFSFTTATFSAGDVMVVGFNAAAAANECVATIFWEFAKP